MNLMFSIGIGSNFPCMVNTNRTLNVRVMPKSIHATPIDITNKQFNSIAL